ncbi:MAG: hypothetical protein HZB46_06390, partial [Solirubrobacterales bacterium]|nr:hypothetical protein [Solirubrobacterales bacterium]
MLSDANPHAVAAGLGGEVWFAHTGSSPVVGRINAAGAITTYTNGISGDPKILGIAEGPGGMWFTEAKKKTVARITDAAAITEFDGLADQPQGITGGPDGSVWFTEAGKGAIGRLTSGGALTEVRSGLTSNANALSITRGPDGNLWFTEAAAKRIGRITPQGVITEFNAGLVTGKPQEIAAGPDGNLWFTESGNAAIGRITPQGVITEFTAGLPGGSAPQGITAGPDGHLYFTDPGANAIGRVTTSGAITTFTAGLPASADPQGIAAGSDGALWFAMEAEGAIGRITALPTVGDVRDAAVTSTTATVSAPVTPNSQATTYVFEYGTTTAYGQTTSSSSAGSGAVEQPATAALTGLSPSTTYHVRVVATNATGTTTGADHVLTTTAAGAPSATTEGATSVAPTGATINATVNPQNAATTYRFEWGTDTSYGTDVPLGGAAAGSDGTDHAVSAPLTGLLPNRTYHFRVVATSSGGTTAGEDRTFTTTALAPGAATGGATGITGEAASIAGTTNPRGSTTLYRFEWGTTAAYDRVAPALDLSAGDGHGDQQVSQDLAGLQPNTTYHYRLVAASDAGTTAGADQSFTTAAVAPAASTGDAGGVTETTAALAGLVNGRNSATTARFEWGTTTAYGNATAATAVADDGLDHPLADVLTGL